MAENGATDGKPTDAQATAYGRRKVAETNAKSRAVVGGMSLTKDVLVEIISVAKVNPVVGAVLALIMVDILAENKVLSPRGATLGYIIVGGAFGVSVADDVINDVTQLITALNPFKQGGATATDPADLIKPVATTFVEAPGTPLIAPETASPWPLDDSIASVRRARAREG